MNAGAMPQVLFYDPLCREPYDSATLRERASGGTEASVTRIADALGACVAQHNRTVDNGNYRQPSRIEGIEHVVVVRESRALPTLRELYPRAQFYLWVHDQMNPGSKRARRLASTARVLRELEVKIVCVSDWQRQRVEATLAGIGLADRVTARTIYNPVADELKADDGPVDADRLVFFSSPNKGLAYALDVFASLRRRMPSLRLLVGNPAYKRGRVDRRDGCGVSRSATAGAHTRERARRAVHLRAELRAARDLWPRVRGIESAGHTSAGARLRGGGGGDRRSAVRCCRCGEDSRIYETCGAQPAAALAARSGAHRRSVSVCLTPTLSASPPGVPAGGHGLDLIRASR
jgi:hypothetical protein